MRSTRWSLIILMAIAACACSDKPAGQPGDWVPPVISSLKQQQRHWYDANLALGRKSDWMLTEPNPAASPEDIRTAEARLGIRFDDQYKQWLAYANGWTAFSGGGNLYALSDISKDSPEHKVMLDTFHEYSIQPSDLEMDSFDNLIIIGGTADGIVYVTVGCREQQCASAPVWEVESTDHTRFADLKEFLNRKITLAKAIVDKLKDERK
ncbi:SMI1/KNR4 family protein [Nocardia sp. NPDC051570]|uniref:SMI1/KNR4 family protein n=1 Tax=Nocardia sp. NPDC051570 TaxID=3364324 RepID=UPI0037B34E20